MEQPGTFELEGKIIAVCEPHSGVSERGHEWMSQEFVLETSEKYPQRVCFSLNDRNTIEKAHIGVGFFYRVAFAIDAREYKPDRWINVIRAYRVTQIESTLFDN